MGKPNAPAYQQYKPAPYPPPPAYSQPEGPAYSPQPYKAPVYSQPPQEYNKPQGYSPPPAAEYKHESYPPEYKQPAYAAPPSQDYKPQAYSPPAPEYKQQQYPPAASPEHEYMAPPPSKPPAHSPSYSPVPSPVYVPPGTYRSSEMSKDETQVTKTEEMNDKESHTMKKMEEMTEQRAAGGPWGAEIESEGMKKEESAMAGGWRQAEGAEENTKESARENEVDEHM
ncbi:uncharacterized protein [Leptinotarsa decemlineata]|uniref:uncharacterized protein n=1 Tax=Leptinotarsa decemlineata TaxID=7539 RepID=UPI003D30B39F